MVDLLSPTIAIIILNVNALNNQLNDRFKE